MIDKLEEKLRAMASRLRLETEKKNAQKNRVEDRRVIQNLDAALGDLLVRRGTGNVNAPPGPPAIGIVEYAMLRREALARGFIKRDESGEWIYESGHVDRDNRPAEKVVKGRTKGMKAGNGMS